MCMREKKLSKRERSRIKIMHTARMLFEEHGIENVTFQQIADAAEVCRTTVFNHFATTKDLMLALYLHEITQVKGYCDQANEEGIPLIRMMFDKLIEDTVCYPALVSQMATNAVLKKEEDKPISMFEDMVKANLPEEVEDRDAMAILIVGAFYGLTNHYHSNNKAFDAPVLKQEFQHLLDILLEKYI